MTTKRDDLKIEGCESLRPYWIALRIGIKYTGKGTAGMNISNAVGGDNSHRLINLNGVDFLVATRFNNQAVVKRLNLSTC